LFQVVGHPRVRALHTSPDAALVDVQLDGAPLATGLTFAEASDYVEFPAGRRQATVLDATEGTPGQVLAHATIDFAPGRDYTLVTLGMASEMHILPLLDTTTPPDGAHAAVRALHASPDAPPLDVRLRGGPTLFERVTFGHATGYIDVPAGTVHLEFAPTGEERSVASLPYHRLAGGDLHTIVILGLLKGEPSLLVLPLIETVAMRLAT
jgi:hypothetical protein